MFNFPAKRKATGTTSDQFGWTARRLWPEDEALVTGHLLRLDDGDRRVRFGHLVTDRFMQNYAALIFKPGSIVIGGFAADGLRGIGAAEPFFADEDAMEAAFSVEHGFKGRGIGTGLFAELMTAVSNSGRERVVMACMRSNVRMIALARNHGATVLESDAYQALYGGEAGSLGDELVEDVLCLALNLRNTPWHFSY